VRHYWHPAYNTNLNHLLRWSVHFTLSAEDRPASGTPQSMIRKSGSRFSEKIMLHQSMIRKSGSRFSEKIMLHQKVTAPLDSI
jgi:hypothetical protein